jgi:queuine tRNA-ribosyltransferase
MPDTLHTPHGDLPLPAFLPDATRAVVKSVDSLDLQAAGVQGIVVNTFHLLTRPGTRILKASGGVHGFMGWPGVVVSDSGGFQIYSLLEADSSLGTVSSKGFTWRYSRDGKKINLTPAKSIQRQFQLGADMMICLDHCTHPDAPAGDQRKSVENTVRWARECRREFDKRIEERKLAPNAKPLLFAVIQGGGDPDLRRECADRLIEIGFDGYSYGGWPLDKDGALVESVEFTAGLMPDSLPKFALGVCGPEHIVACVKMGYTIFDGALPTRDARRGRLYIHKTAPRKAMNPKGFYKRIYLQDEDHISDPRPVDETCDCLLCSHYSRSYLYHLYKIEDPLAWRLATIHNLRFYSRLMATLTVDGTGGGSS